MTDTPTTGTGKRGAYKAAEVCEIAHIQSYVLRSWESEFPRLGVVRSGVRIYRQADLEQVLRIKQLVFEQGLTLAGARRRIEEDGQPQAELPLEEFVTPELRQQIGRVKEGLQELLGLLGARPPSGSLTPAEMHIESRPSGGDGKEPAVAAPEHATARTKKKPVGGRDRTKVRAHRRHAGRA